MPELSNSQRALYKATYIPTLSRGLNGGTGRVADKVSFLRSLSIKLDEFLKLKLLPLGTLQIPPVDYPDNPYGADARPLLIDVAAILTNDLSLATMGRYGPLLQNVSPSDLAAVGTALATIRGPEIVTSIPPPAPLPPGGAGGIVVPPPPPGNVVDPGERTRTLVTGLMDRFAIEPIGRLHLERLEMTPVGIEHGELVHSVPLTPKETVNISHREWSVKTSTFENIVQDSLEGYSETGVTDKTDLTQAAESESKHSSALDVNANVSASYNGGTYSVTASTGLDYKASSDERESEKVSRAHSIAMTRNASARTRKDHKFSFKVSSQAGTEDLAVRVLTNPSETSAMRVDYYQLLRKWRVDLIRYGLRMTYDIVVPSPGADLITKLYEIRTLDEAIAAPFKFDLISSTIDESTFEKDLLKYGGNVDPPIAEQMSVVYTGLIPFRSETDSAASRFENLEMDIEDRYEVATCTFRAEYADWTGAGHPGSFVIVGGPAASKADLSTGVVVASLRGKSGRLSIVIGNAYVSTASMTADVDLKLKDIVFKQWQFKAWTAMRESAQQQYVQQREAWKEQRKQLEGEIAKWDALTLRRMEREEIMKGVLRWLFGPGFDLVPAEVENLYSAAPQAGANPATGELTPLVQSQEQWERIMKYGEFIKYIHNAIEWENVIYFAYPYFWEAVENWEFKRFLLHPDPEHRTFLRAGCARVVLTVRPGFEQSFASMLETGSFNQTMQSGDYVDIGNEIHNFAMTNYGGIPPANPDHNVRSLLYPPQRKAWSEMQDIMTVLEAFKVTQKAYPTTAQGLTALAALLPVVDESGKELVKTLAANDPWGRPYVYTCPGMNGEYDLVSYGQNGSPGGSDLNADITSWAEGSVIGSWYEYTPTSALDVTITMLPAGSGLATHPEPA